MSPHFVTAVSQEPEERRQRYREICEAVARHIELFYADKYRRLNRMRILDKIRSWRQLHICLLDDLARSAGRCETLAINLRRHAEQCREPNIKIGLERLATAEAEQANALRKLLLARGVWPRLATSPSRAGSNNWERLTADLALQLEIVRGLNLQIAKLEGDEPELAARLREFAFKEDKNLSGLRDFAAKCDPQALN